MKDFDTSLYKKIYILQSKDSPYFCLDVINKSDLLMYKSGKAYIVYKDAHNSFDSKMIKLPYNLVAKAMLGSNNIIMEGEFDGDKRGKN